MNMQEFERTAKKEDFALGDSFWLNDVEFEVVNIKKSWEMHYKVYRDKEDEERRSNAIKELSEFINSNTRDEQERESMHENLSVLEELSRR